jgi:hypothetical protein
VRQTVNRRPPISEVVFFLINSPKELIFLLNDKSRSPLSRRPNDFNRFTAKADPHNNDLLLIEDSQDSFKKKKVTIAQLKTEVGQGPQGEPGPQGEQGEQGPAGPQGDQGDPGVLESINGLPEKTNLVQADILLLEDSAAAFAKKKATIANLFASFFRYGKVQLNGVNPTPVNFQGNTAATVTSTNGGPFNLVGVGDGGTIIVTTDALALDTATFNFAAGTSVSGANAPENISAEIDNKFMISADDDAAELIELNLAACTTGANTAAEMQTKIRAKGGNKANITVGFAGNQYTITSSRLGTSSRIVITNAANGNIAEELKLGTANGGTETAGTGDVANAAAVTAQEIIDVLNADLGDLTASLSGQNIVLSSKTTGRLSKLTIGNGTLNAVIGLTNAAVYCGAIGLGYSSDMADANYIVTAALDNTTKGSLAAKNLSVTGKTVSGFILICETDAATDFVALHIFGQEA